MNILAREANAALAQYADLEVTVEAPATTRIGETLAFDEAVNVTLGLPFVRTSPDHGTAFDIAGKGLAEHSSMVAAIKLAADLSSRAGESGRAVEV